MLTLQGDEIRAEAKFKTGKFSKDILSLGKLYREGYDLIFSRKMGSCIQLRGRRVLVKIIGNTFYIEPTFVGAHTRCGEGHLREAAPVAREGLDEVGAEVDGGDNDEAVADVVADVEEAVPCLDAQVADPGEEFRPTLPRSSYVADLKDRLRPSTGRKSSSGSFCSRPRLSWCRSRRSTPTWPSVARHHQPAASWRVQCIRGKGVEEAHRRANVTLRDAQIPMPELDYSFLKTDGEEGAEHDSAHTTVSLYDKSTGTGVALSVLGKNENMDYDVATLTQHLNQLGHMKAKLRTDGEPVVKRSSSAAGQGC